VVSNIQYMPVCFVLLIFVAHFSFAFLRNHIAFGWHCVCSDGILSTTMAQFAARQRTSLCHRLSVNVISAHAAAVAIHIHTL